MLSVFSYLLSPWVIFFGIAVYALYKWSTHTYDYFEKRNMVFEKPVPLLGTIARIILMGECPFDYNIRLYSKFKNEKLFGLFEFRKPIFVINDPDIIKQITIKDFDHFLNHREFVAAESEPLFHNPLFSLRDQKWKDMRMTLSPAFTGSKLRQMFEFVESCCQAASLYLENEAKISHSSLELDIKEFFTRFTNDVIATTAFGLEINSLTEKENVFFKMGTKLTNFSSLKMFFFFTFERIMKVLDVKLFDKESTSYFRSLVLDTMNYSVEKGINRNDMINLLIEARKGNLRNFINDTDGEIKNSEQIKLENRKWSDDDIAAQCFLFFFAGFETTSTLMCFCAHELMENPEIQEKLIKEIDEVRENLNGNQITYEILQKMKYLDMVMSETLRKWPLAVGLDRICTKPYTIDDPITGKCVDISIGDLISIPVAGIHYDPKYYPNPKKFDPERFNDDNKHSINPFTYMPFGIGPRNCIGTRFALMEAKAIIFHLLCEFTFKASPKSSIPIKLGQSFQLKPVNGFWLKFEPRQ